MLSVVDPLLVTVLLTNFFILGTSRLRAAITGTALQGVLLGSLVVFVHGEIGVQTVLVAMSAILLKALFIPGMLMRATRDAAIRREIEPVIGFVPSLLLGAAGTFLSLVFANTLPLAPMHKEMLLIPAALATVITGFVILTTRRQAIMQIAGYLVLENGIFLMGLSLLFAIPFLVELGVLLDLVVGVFIMGIIIEHISKNFASLDTSRLSSLKE